MNHPAFDSPDSHSFEIQAPSRLHFGLLTFGDAAERKYGGAGLMIQRPSSRLVAEPAEGFQASGPGADRVTEFARRWAAFHGRELPACRLRLVQSPPAHEGLGTGTGLALSVAVALHRVAGELRTHAAELAASVGRGQRSAVGAYGFLQGGFIIERGKTEAENLSPLDCRLPAPACWRVALLRPNSPPGLSGAAELAAFARLPSPPAEITQELWRELRCEMAPAVSRGDCQAFGESVYRYGRLSGECFAAVQGGPYNGRAVSDIVSLVRALGVAGVGQSSWGPTVFAILGDPAEARQFEQDWLRAGYPASIALTAIDNAGASVQPVAAGSR